MSRYGWSNPDYSRGGVPISPFASSLTDDRGAVPAVTDEDYSYITSEDLETHGLAAPGYADRRDARSDVGGYYSRSLGGPSLVTDEDDILLIKNKGVTYPEHFPAYSIGDGKLLAGDVRERVQMIMKLSDRRTRRIKLLYKGSQLKDDEEPVCRYGVKNKSEILVVLPDSSLDDDDSSGESSEEVVVVGSKDGDARKKSKGRGKKKGKSRRSKGSGGARSSSNSPRDSQASVNALPAGSPPRPQSPSGASNANSLAGGTAPVAGGPIEKLNAINSHFKTKLLPLCVQFTASPPADPKKREEEHRRLAETVLQQVLLKLDEVETNGEPEARAKRKELVQQVQEVLKGLDNRLDQ